MPSSPGSEGDERLEQPAGGQVAQADAGPEQAVDREELEQRNAELEDRHKRALADLDNYRKRSAREIDRRVADSREVLTRQWLEAIDSVERALRMGEPENPLFEGLRAVLEQMEAILDRQGVRRIGEAGEPFDPERHDAVAVQPSDEVPDRTVLEVARSGWAIDNRVLRPAQVVVSRREEREH